MGRRAVEAAALLSGRRPARPAGPAAGDPGTDKARVDDRLGQLRGNAADASQRAGVLTEELSAVAGRVRTLQAGVDAQQARLVDAGGDARERAGAARGARPHDRRADVPARAAAWRVQHRAVAARASRPRAVHDRRPRCAFLRPRDDVVHRHPRQPRAARPDRPTGRADRREGQVRAGRRGRRAPADDGRARGGSARRGGGRGGHLRAAHRRHRSSSRAGTRSSPRGATKSTTLASIQEDRESVLAEIHALEQQSAALAERIRQAQQQGSTAPPVVPPSRQRPARLARVRPRDERLRAAVGTDARGDRHHGARGNAGAGCRCRHGDPRRLARRLRQPRRRRPRRRALDRLRAQLVVRVVGRPVGRRRPGRRVLRATRATRAARTSISRSASTEPPWIRSATCSPVSSGVAAAPVRLRSRGSSAATITCRSGSARQRSSIPSP